MRVVFTAYAINSAAICFVLTIALMICEEFSDSFERLVDWIVDYMYVAFGPVMLTFCAFGLTSLNGLAYQCHPERPNEKLNFIDVFILLVCLCLSSFILFVYALQKTNKLAEDDLGNENSLFYQVFISQLRRQRTKYHEEKRQREERRAP